MPSSYDGSQQFQPDFLPKAAFAAGLNASRTSTPSPKKGFHSMKPKDQTVKPGNSEDAQTGLDQFAAQLHLVNSRFSGAWPCWDGCAHPGLAWWLSPSSGTSSAPFSNTSRAPQVFGEHCSSQRMCCPAGDEAQAAPGNELQP